MNDSEEPGATGVQDQEDEGDAGTDEEEEDRPLSDTLVRDLTAHRTLGLRLNLSEQPTLRLPMRSLRKSSMSGRTCMWLASNRSRPTWRPMLWASRIRQRGTWADRHANWARQMPRDVTALWAFVAELDHDSRLALLAHCVALTVNAVKLPWEKKPRAHVTADRLAEAVALDMSSYWRPTARSYLGRVTKARILDAVREGVSAEAAERMVGMKKVEMAEAAEQLLAGTGWLPRSDQERKGASRDQDSDGYPQAA